MYTHTYIDVLTQAHAYMHVNSSTRLDGGKFKISNDLNPIP